MTQALLMGSIALEVLAENIKNVYKISNYNLLQTKIKIIKIIKSFVIDSPHIYCNNSMSLGFFNTLTGTSFCIIALINEIKNVFVL